MLLRFHVESDWPGLAWAARFDLGSDEVHIRRGTLVEQQPDWCAEAVWAGPFHEGDFDRTSLVFGSGVRCREGAVVFVSSGATTDRLWYGVEAGSAVVSNSLPALLASVGESLSDAYENYLEDVQSIVRGLDGYVKALPTTSGTVRPVYFHNLRYDGRTITEEPKPEEATRLDDFSTYRTFLCNIATKLARNAGASERNVPVSLATTISAGYDSPAAAVVAREAGCTRAHTLKRARSVVPRSDSGTHLADMLDLECRSYRRSENPGTDEVHFWAALGTPQDVNLASFEFRDRLTLLFTGFDGDVAWNRAGYDYSCPFARTDSTGLGLCEYRLTDGIFHCPVPYWGIRQLGAIHRISTSEEMLPWSVGGTYDRPVPRRIVEEAGVPRDAFARRKNATSSNRVVGQGFLWPRAIPLQRSFRRYLGNRGYRISSIEIGGRKLQDLYYHYLAMPLAERLPVSVPFKPQIAGPWRRLSFQWSNHWVRDRVYRR